MEFYGDRFAGITLDLYEIFVDQNSCSEDRRPENSRGEEDLVVFRRSLLVDEGLALIQFLHNQ
jgi:hypothetical protein